MTMMTNCEHAVAKSQAILESNQLEMKSYEQLYQVWLWFRLTSHTVQLVQIYIRMIRTHTDS